jgi:heme-degrading monooxygenase HmoA
MFIRVTWFQSSPDRLEEQIASFPQQMATGLGTLGGYMGASLLVDRGTGAGAAVSYWESAESMQASEEAGAALRAQVTAADGGQIREIDRFELVVQERTAPPRANTYLRVNDLPGTAGKVDDLANLVRGEAMSVLRAQTGFRAVLMGANRQTGRMVVASVWETATDREASVAALQELRERAPQVAGAESMKTELYESAYAEVKQVALA